MSDQTPEEKAQALDAESDLEKRRKMVNAIAEFQEWQNIAARKGWKLPGNSPLPNHSWLHYWKSMAAYEADPKTHGRPVIPHRTPADGEGKQ